MNESNVSFANYSNISSANTDCIYHESDLAKIVKRITIIVLNILGISLNIFVIILATRSTVHRKNLHHLIINMAVSDALYLFMVLLFCTPWMSGYKWSIYPSGTLGLVTCKTTMFLMNTSKTVSLITLLVISIERFRATRGNLQRIRPYSLKRRVLILGVTWFIPIPTGAGYCAYIANIYNIVCFLPYWMPSVYPAFITFNMFYAILCGIIIILSILTARRLSKPQAIHANLSAQQQEIRKRRTVAAVRMVSVSTILYSGCLLPLCVFLILIPDNSLRAVCVDWDSLFFIIGYFLPVFNSCFSPCIYILFLPDYREATKKVLCRKCTLNLTPNRRNSFELQSMPNRPNLR